MPEYIDREALIDDICAAIDKRGIGYVIGNTMRRYALRVPAADVAPIVHGQWNTVAVGDCAYACSKCGFIRDGYLLDVDNYCPRCGARMDGGESDA